MLKNSSGLKAELNHSRDFHQIGLPLLVSENLLRSRGLGQIDLSRMKKERGEWVIELAEVKTRTKGVLMMGLNQRHRLFSSLKFLTSLMGCGGKLILLSETDNRVD